MSTPPEQVIATAVLADAPFRTLVADYKNKLDEIASYTSNIASLQELLARMQANLATATQELQVMDSSLSSQLSALVKSHLP